MEAGRVNEWLMKRKRNPEELVKGFDYLTEKFN